MIQNYFNELIMLTNEMSPYLLLGFLIAGILHVAIPNKTIVKYLGKNNFKSVLYATLIGIPLPLCSCGVIPTGISFKKEGASDSATVSFLISTPQTGVDSIMITYSLLGLPFAILRPLVALVSGLLGGLLTASFSKKIIEKAKPTYSLRIDKESLTDNCDYTSDLHKKENKIQAILRYGFVEFMEDIAKWLLIGLALAAFISVLIPPNFFTQYISNSFLNMFLVLLISIPLYICATGSVPLVAVLLMKGITPGAALIFLMAGPATNIATITVLSKSLGKRTTFFYLFSIIISAIIFGLGVDYLLPPQWFNISNSMYNCHNHSQFEWINIISSILLLILIINGLIKKYRVLWYSEKAKINTITIAVYGMTCNHCKANVEKNISKLPGITSVNAIPSKNEVNITGTNFSIERVKLAINSIGYKTEN